MSKRNSAAAKTAARERLRAERERQAKRAKVRRQLIVAGSVVGVLAIAGGIGYAVVQNSKPSYWESAKDDKLVKPANTTGTNGTTVVFGKSTAKKTLVMYEDPRCPDLRPVRAGRRLDREERLGRRQVQDPVRRRHVHRQQGQRRGLQERAERHGCRAEHQPRGVPRVQDRALLDEVPPGRDDRHVQGRLVPDQGREHGPRPEEQQGLPEGREGRHLRQVGAGHVRHVRQERGDRHADPEDGRQGADLRRYEPADDRGHLQHGAHGGLKG
jgi:hypothetical protein